MSTRLLAITLLISAAVCVVACSGDDKKEPRGPLDKAQGVATQVTLPGTPLLQNATPALTALAGGTATASTPPVPSTASGSTVSVPFPFENAVQARESLLGNARFGPPMDDLDKSDPVDTKAYPGWARVYPSLRLVGSSINATPQTVSVYRNLLQDKQAPSATNPKLIVFTVMDSKGVCAAGVIRGYPNYNDYAPIDIGTSACNASAAVAILRR